MFGAAGTHLAFGEYPMLAFTVVLLIGSVKLIVDTVKNSQPRMTSAEITRLKSWKLPMIMIGKQLKSILVYL